jgi:DNA-binding SARP family transcriptional activator
MGFSYNEIVHADQSVRLSAKRNQSMSKLTLHLLGTFQVEYDQRPVTQFRSDKERALLAYLAVEHNRPHRRDTLIGLLWPEQTQALAQNNLRKALTRLRQTLPTPEAYLLITPAAVQFNAAALTASAATVDINEWLMCKLSAK